MRQSGFFSRPFKVERGCTQGDTNSPIIFNLIIDAVLRMWKTSHMFKETRACFYADNGLLEHTDPDLLQVDLNEMVLLLERFGLKTNELKTKFMILRGAEAPRALEREVYDRMRRRG